MEDIDKNHPSSRVVDDDPEHFVYTPPQGDVNKAVAIQEPQKKKKKAVKVLRK